MTQLIGKSSIISYREYVAGGLGTRLAAAGLAVDAERYAAWRALRHLIVESTPDRIMIGTG